MTNKSERLPMANSQKMSPRKNLKATSYRLLAKSPLKKTGTQKLAKAENSARESRRN